MPGLSYTPRLGYTLPAALCHRVIVIPARPTADRAGK
jgi:hypothetical protein